MQQMMIHVEDTSMNTAKVFTSGRSQAVRIPKEYRFDVDEVFINKIGDTVMLTPVKSLAAAFEEGAHLLSDDYLMDGIPEAKPSERLKL